MPMDAILLPPESCKKRVSNTRVYNTSSFSKTAASTICIFSRCCGVNISPTRLIQSKVMNSTIRYEIIIYWSQKDEAFIAEVPELSGCMADGATYREAL